ncbi:MAG: F0F1 ATP synthase subunit B [Candidatus Lightella neohaematopini]|nr:F0F1 ATP synthase subunit B [Candidatus Lightella neohaematopini]MCV2529052.1 F0F1 ATP synthase subunit B [Candidatus Lightella neohaematopini]
MNINATIIGQTVAFVIFVIFCMKYIWPPLINIIETRQKEINDGLEFAKQAKLEVAKSKQIAADTILNAKLKAEDIIKLAHEHEEKIINDAKIAANKEYKYIISQANIKINSNYNQAKQLLYEQVNSLVLASTKKVISHYISNYKIDDILINEIINKIKL